MLPLNSESPSARFDVFCIGPLFVDVALAGLSAPPRPGTEVWADSMAFCPGGTATVATAASRLGARSGIATAVGDDPFGRLALDFLVGESVDVSRAAVLPQTGTPLTVSLAFDGDRAMVTHGSPLDPAMAVPPPSATVFVYLPPDRRAPGLDMARRPGALLVGDTAWDPTQNRLAGDIPDLRLLDVFTPNASEAMSLTRASDPVRAAELLTAYVPLVVVTLGREGALAIDKASGQTCRAPGVPVAALDTLGAGEVFTAGLMTGFARGMSLPLCLLLATVASGLAVRRSGGAASAPTLEEVAGWCRAAREEGARTYDPLLEVLA